MAVLATVVAACQSTSPRKDSGVPARTFPFIEVSIAELQRQMTSGERSSKEIVERYLARIDRIDGKGPTLRSVIELNPEALAIAAALDAERAGGRVRGPLHGIPILVKDNVATADRTETTAGSLALVGARPKQDAFLVRRLRDAGAVILGKTNLSEWANFRSMRSTSGWSARGGQTRNPYVLDRSPCGSSSGSAVAVSANLVAAAIGTETDGSIVCPASATGIVGIKPTVGLVSRTGIIPIAHSQDTAGPMARTVADAALVLSAIVGVDGEDEATARSAGHAKADYTAFLGPDGLAGMRIGVARQFFSKDPAVHALMEAALAAIRDGGAELIDPVRIPMDRGVGAAEMEVLVVEFKHGLQAYLSRLDDGAPRSIDDIITFNQKNAQHEMPFFGQDIFLRTQAAGALDDPQYLKAKQTMADLRDVFDRIMVEQRLDAVVAPTGSPAWTIDPVNGDHFQFGSSTVAAVAGYPNVSVPAGFVHGLPVGVSFFGVAWSEPTLIAIAHAFEQKVKARRPPVMMPTLVVPRPSR